MYDTMKEYRKLSSSNRKKRPPVYLLQELAYMFGMTIHQLRQKMAVAARKGLPHPLPTEVKGGGGTYTSKRLQYYRKADFVKFLQGEASETTHTT